jgi:hypothetical protein
VSTERTRTIPEFCFAEIKISAKRRPTRNVRASEFEAFIYRKGRDETQGSA